MKIVALSTDKGGPGKTTLALTLASGLALNHKRVLLVDADPQGSATISLNEKKRAGFYNLLVRADEYQLSDLVQVIPREVYAPVGTGSNVELRLLPGNRETMAIAGQVHDPHLLETILHEGARDIDVVIIDVQPTPGLLIALIYAATEHLLVPVVPEFLSIDGLLATIRIAEKERVKLLGIVPNMVRARQVGHSTNLEKMRTYAAGKGWPVLSAINQSAAWSDASNLTQSIFRYEKRGKAATEAWRFVDEVEARLYE